MTLSKAEPGNIYCNMQDYYEAPPLRKRSVEERLFLRFYGGGYQTSSSSSKSAPQLNPQQLLQLYGQALPQISNVGASNIAPINTSLAQSAAGANPIYTQSTLDQLQGSGGQYAGAGADISNINDLLSAGILGSGGAALAGGANNLLAQTNPAQAAANTQASNLVNSINLNGLSGGEQAAVERSLNQSNYATGNLGLDNATNAVSNAMNFGQALQAKRAALGSALGTASGVSGSQNAQFNPVNTALANPGQNNFALGQFNPNSSASTITSPLSFASSIFSPLASNASSQKSTSGSNSNGWNFSI